MTEEKLLPKLKRCAHCGSEDIRIHKEKLFLDNIKKIMCWGCGIQTQYDPKAIEKWNQRA